MKLRTRYFLLGAAGILALGLAAGLVAYLQGGPPALAIAQAGPGGLRYVPEDAHILAYANVRDVMLSELRQRLRQVEPDLDGQREFRDQTGIDIERDIDQVVAGLVPAPDEANSEPRALVVLSGRFDTTRLEALAREHGSIVDEHLGTRLLRVTADDNQFAMAFVEPGVIALGSEPTVRRAIELPSTGGDVTENPRLMELMSYIEGGANAWAVGEFDDPDAMAWLPDQVESQIPPVAAFAVSGWFNGGVSASITAEARDAEAGQNLRDVVQGFVALARMQASSQPELTGLLDSIQLSNVDSTVTLSFAVPAEVLEMALPERADEPR